MSKIKILSTAILLLSSIAICSSQSVVLSAKFLRNNTWEQVKDYAVCPGVDIQYQILNWNPSCHTMKVFNGYPENDVTSNVSSDGKIIISWKDTGERGFIEVKRKDSNCFSSAPSQSFSIPVLSLANISPTITQVPPGKLNVGFIHNVTYKAQINYPFLGKKDSLNLNDFKLTEFIWTTPSNWTLTSLDEFETITLTTDLGTGGNVTAQAYNRVCTGSSLSKAKIFKAERKMPSPCPIVSATQPYELCGESIFNTFNCAGLPLNFTSPPQGVTYQWSVSPSDGWTKIGELDNTVKYKTDGQKDRTVKVKVSAYGVSDSCTQFIPLRLTNPLTKVVGPEIVCQEGTYKLSLSLPTGVTGNWNIHSLTSGFPVPVSPSTGAGTEAELIVGSGGALCQISFNLSGCGVSSTLKDTFFAGLPAIYDQKIDGSLGFQSQLCPGTHWVSLEIQGADSTCVSWEEYGNNPVYLYCLGADVYMNGYNGSTALNANVKNVCGTQDAWFFLQPRNWGCDERKWYFSIYPNPAVNFVTIETKLAENSQLTEPPLMAGIRLISSTGTVAYQSTQTSQNLTISLAGISPGLYTLQSVVDGIPVSEIIEVKIE